MRGRGLTHVGPGALCLGVGLWVAAVVLAPIAITSSNRIVSSTAALVYAGGARVCHQRPERCFWIGGRPLPVCARCTGLYVAAAAGAPVALLLASAMSSARARRVAMFAALPTLITWGLEFAGLAHPSNIVRAIAALPLGFAAAWLVIVTLVDEPRPPRDLRG